MNDEYRAGWKLTNVFPVHSVGIVTARDKLAIRWTADEMSRVAKDFSERDSEEARSFYRLGKDARDWRVQLAQEDVRRADGCVVPVLYRPFDQRFTYYTGRSRGFICMPRPKVMRHMLAGENIGIVTTRQCQRNWSAIVSNTIIAHKALAAYDINSLFPLYFYPTATPAHGAAGRAPNLNPKFTRGLAAAIGLDFIPDGNGDRTTTFDPKDVFHYIYAVLHSPEYRRRYADFLKSDFPRIPLPAHSALFSALILPGALLVSLHLMETENRRAGAAFPSTGSNQVDQVRYAPPSSGLPGRVWINREQYFESVEPKIWAFTIGGYRPAEKWLKDRKGRALSEDDIDHYLKIIAALAETRRLMVKLDEVIGKHGGWPGAFQTGAQK